MFVFKDRRKYMNIINIAPFTFLLSQNSFYIILLVINKPNVHVREEPEILLSHA